MFKTLMLLASLTLPSTTIASPDNYPSHDAVVVHPVFYTIDFSVDGYAVMPAKSAQKTVVPMTDAAPPILMIHPSSQVSPNHMVSKLAEQIDRQLNKKKKTP